MPKQLLVEGASGAFPFIVDRSKPFVTEAQSGGISHTKIPGRFSICDCVNGNNRRYRKNVWEKNLVEGSPLQESIKRNAAFGLLEHPKDGIVTLNSPISHVVTAARMVESAGNGKPVHEVLGEITVINTQEGQKLKALIEVGYNPLVSSRGYGSLVKAEDGVDDVQEDFICESFDVVIKPSFDNAELAPQRESKQATSTTGTTAATTIVLEQKTTSQDPPPPSTQPPQVKTIVEALVTKPMSIDIKDIRARIAALRGTDSSKLDPTRFAESISLVESIHNDVAVYVAEDAKRAYEGQRLHKELDRLTETWQQVVDAPKRQAGKLHEDNIKLMKVIDAVAKTGVTYKTKLGEAIKLVTQQKGLAEELTKRGKGWKRLAEARGEAAEKLDKHFDTACEALDLMSERYHADVTELGRRIIILEFKEKAQAAEIQEKLKTATRLRHIIKIRETLEGKPKEKALAEEKEEPKKEEVKPVTGVKAVTEDKKKEEKKVPVTEAKKEETNGQPGRLVENVRFGTANVNESVAMVRRLSTSVK